MTARRFEVYEVRECEHGLRGGHVHEGRLLGCPGGGVHRLSSIPDDLLEKANKAVSLFCDEWDTAQDDVIRLGHPALSPLISDAFTEGVAEVVLGVLIGGEG